MIQISMPLMTSCLLIEVSVPAVEGAVTVCCLRGWGQAANSNTKVKGRIERFMSWGVGRGASHA